MPPVTPASSEPICYQVQQQTATICFTGTRPTSIGSGCTRPALGGSGSLCLLTGSHFGQTGAEVTRLPMQQNH